MTAADRREPRPGPEGTATPVQALRLRRLNRWQAETLREDLADLSVESARTGAGRRYRGREAFLRRLTSAIRRPGFALLIAEGTAFAGCAYGFPVPREGTWWSGFHGSLPPGVEQLTASGHVFAIIEIMVHPHSGDEDLARRLQRRLLGDHYASLGATLVDPADGQARDAFLSWGWQDIGAVRRPSDPAARQPSAPVLLRALVLPLGTRSTSQPNGLAHENRTQRPD
ncbi:hypothetical protein [Streptomyces sp. NPDC000983]|uniref:hypothetical protein n=1 Tax=Streptomyces sp. NPDC000983 TaxID=3154373 RepID=UPI003319E82A